MTKVKIAIPTDLLWNNSDLSAAEKYPEHAAKIAPHETISSLDEIARRTPDGEKRSRHKHVLTNLRCVEDNSTPDSEETKVIEIGGICIFERANDGSYQLSDAGAQLREAYQREDEDEWQAILAELLCRHFVRLRTFLYYMGVAGCSIKYGKTKSFWGNEYLVQGELEYQYFSTEVETNEYNGAYTIAGLVDAIEDSEIEHYHPWSLAIIRLLYDIEYAAAASEFREYRAPLFEIEKIKDLLMEVLTESERSHALTKLNQATADAIEIISGIVNDESDFDWVSNPSTTFRSLKDIVTTDVTDHDLKQFSRVPNLLLDANKHEIIGPFLSEKIESQIRTKLSDAEIEITAPSSSEEPLGGNIVLVTHYAMSFLMELNILEETEDQNHRRLAFDRAAAMRVLPTDVVEEISVEEEGQKRPVLSSLHKAYIKNQDSSNYAVWADIRSEVCDQLGISKTEFRDEVELLLSRSDLSIDNTKKGVLVDGDGPPGETDPRVRLSFPGLT